MKKSNSMENKKGKKKLEEDVKLSSISVFSFKMK